MELFCRAAEVFASKISAFFRNKKQSCFNYDIDRYTIAVLQQESPSQVIDQQTITNKYTVLAQQSTALREPTTQTFSIAS